MRLPLSGGSFYNGKKISGIYKSFRIWDYEVQVNESVGVLSVQGQSVDSTEEAVRKWLTETGHQGWTASGKAGKSA